MVKVPATNLGALYQNYRRYQPSSLWRQSLNSWVRFWAAG